MIHSTLARAALQVLACTVPLLSAGASHAVSAFPAEGRNGMVSSAHRLATDVGVSVLQAGGNAVDAAVAIGYALAVTMPQPATSAAAVSWSCVWLTAERP
ncbi:gamma-glutamyltransferase [Variovorax sp. E3]|uniref:gamma-glutamyltransferase n=1 Tax=Variovorax sp. E3 TaxID=1914993 RepID=UPI0022B73286|nr:gamma-glutamyltransferase [Variovorax sp. E3]